MKHELVSRLTLLALFAAGSTMFGCASREAIEIRALSNRADLVSDGDVLVEIGLPVGAEPEGLKVHVDGHDATPTFARRDGRLMGLVRGLVIGANRITATAPGARAGTLLVKNAPRGGPVLSGPQVNPFFCATPIPQPASGDRPATNASGLSTAAIDAQCNIATEYKLYYRTTAKGCSFALPDRSPSAGGFADPRQAVPFTSTDPPKTTAAPANGCFKPYDPSASRPDDLATTTTDAGLTVPYIVRVERGTLNRGIYEIAALYDPSRPWSALAPQSQWNGKLLYRFGFANGHGRRQVRPMIPWSDNFAIFNTVALERGYVVAANSLTDSRTNSNRVLMAETLMMMKEHIIEQYGPVRFTIGTGASGGALNSLVSASIAPGLLDGIILAGTVPDGETLMTVPDCTLLVDAYAKPEWRKLMTSAGYTPEQLNAKKAAINGHPDQTGCHGYYGLFSRPGNYHPIAANASTGEITTSPITINDCELPLHRVYDAATNPAGERCDEAAWAASIWGKIDGTPFVKITRDNVGVQYGLSALTSGAITAEEFVTINELVGGFDRDGNVSIARSAADAAALETAYRAGIVASGRNLAKVAIIDLRGWNDAGPGGIHHIWLSFAIRDRIEQEYGDAANHVMWRWGRSGPIPIPVPSESMSRDALLAMDVWLTRLAADTRDAPIEQRVRAARPADLAFNYCLLSSDATQSIKVTDEAKCNSDPLLRPSSSPRGVAGAPRAASILKCQLKRLNAADYAADTFSEAQWTRLQTVFPQGVCDWSKPGVGQQPPQSPLTFAGGSAGRP